MSRKSLYAISVENEDLALMEDGTHPSTVPAEGEIAADLVSIEEDIETLDEASEVQEQLEEQVEVNEEALEQPDAVTEELVEASNECLSYALGKLGAPFELYRQHKISQEGVSVAGERLKLSTESIKETIIKIIQKIKEFFLKIYDKIKNLIRKYNPVLRLRLKKLQDKYLDKKNSDLLLASINKLQRMGKDVTIEKLREQYRSKLENNSIVNFGASLKSAKNWDASKITDFSFTKDIEYFFITRYHKATGTLREVNEITEIMPFLKVLGAFGNICFDPNYKTIDGDYLMFVDKKQLTVIKEFKPEEIANGEKSIASFMDTYALDDKYISDYVGVVFSIIDNKTKTFKNLSDSEDISKVNNGTLFTNFNISSINPMKILAVMKVLEENINTAQSECDKLLKSFGESNREDVVNLVKAALEMTKELYNIKLKAATSGLKLLVDIVEFTSVILDYYVDTVALEYIKNKKSK